MGKFKVGDRVRVLHTDYPEEIPVGTVTTVVSVDRDGDAWLDGKTVRELFFFDHELELAPKFAVGDRVRVANYPADYWCGDGKIAEVHGDIVIVAFDDGKRRGGFDIKWVEPVAASPEAATPLVIQAGRYYKTRDGRKVGPLVEQKNTMWPLRAADTNDIENEWRLNGRWQPNNPHGEKENRLAAAVLESFAPVDHDNDLIAEWVDEQREVPGPEYDWDAELRAIEEGEPDTRLTLTIMADLSELDAEIDRVKRRLKKLAKRSRKLGIRLEYDLAA